MESRRFRWCAWTYTINGNTNGHESQITQHVRGCVSPRLFLSFSKPTNLEPTLHCSLCSPARASLQYDTFFSNLVGSNHGRGLSQSGASDSSTAVPSHERFTCFLLGNVSVLRRLLVRRHMLAMHPHRGIHPHRPWWPGYVQDARVPTVPGRNRSDGSSR